MTSRTVDLTDLDSFEANQAWPMFDELRSSAPVYWHTEPAPNHGFWAITRHADVVAVDRDPETFTSTDYVNLEEVTDDHLREVRRSMMETDGIRHRALRKLLAREFGARTLQGFEQFLRDLTRVTVDTALQHEEFDFVKLISADFPIKVLARLLDVPSEHTGQLIDWGNRLIGNSDPDYADVLLNDPASDQYRHLPFRSPASLEVFDYGRGLAARRRGGTGEDLVSKLVNRMPSDGVALSPRDFDNYFLLLVVAGNETTRHAITSSMLALINNPEQLRLLQERPELLPTAVEELLRWASPVYHFRRTATRDVDLHGEHIGAGDKVVMWFASANRDSEVFANPYTLDVTRSPNDHVTFGKGSPHFCMGNNLARLEIRLMFEALLPRLRSIEVAGDIRRVRSNFVNGIKQLPVRVRAA